MDAHTNHCSLATWDSQQSRETHTTSPLPDEDGGLEGLFLRLARPVGADSALTGLGAHVSDYL